MIEYDIEFHDPGEPRRTKELPKYSVIYEDERVMAFDKGPGLSVIPERYPGATSLKTLAEEKFGRLWTVHRIDKDTSGVILFARDAEAHKALNDQFERHEPLKIYAAFVEGEMADDEMRIDIPLAPDSSHPGRMRPSARGKESLTVIRVRERFRGYTYIEAEPKTGRQHQIRVHCKAVGLPLAIDAYYGNHQQILLSELKRSYRDYGRDEKPLVDRLTLHAERLTVVHPGTGQPITFEAELPRDLRALLTQLRKTRAIKKTE